MIRKELRPGLKPGLDLRGDEQDFRREFPFRRSWPAIAVLAVFDAAFTVPAVITLNQAINEWTRIDSLFDLVGALFLSLWLLGWVTAPLIMTGILALLIFGREVLKARRNTVDIFLGLPVVGLTARYDVRKMRNLRFDRPPGKSGKAWRGPHLLFDYGANTIAFGSNFNGDDLAELRRQLETATGARIRRGEALPRELETAWEPDEEVSPEISSFEATVRSESTSWLSPSTLLLVIANLIPVAGSIFWGWNLADVMVLYWAESAVIGFFNLCKIIVIGRWMALLAGPFFIGHFGGFMAVHFLFIYTIFVKQPQAGTDLSGNLEEVAQVFILLWPALLALFLSHAFSFYTNFLGRHEYRGRTVNQQMSEPYSRIIFMHLVLILGGGLTLVLGGATPVLIIVIALKILFDVRAHLKQHHGV